MAAWSLAAESWREALLEQIAGAIAGGVDVIQVRENDLDAGPCADFVQRCLALAAATPVKVIVNDRLDVALAAGAHGVHLKESSISIAAARGLAGPPFKVGRSVHDSDTAERARAADYLIAGTVFATQSKSGAPASLGLAGLRRVVDAAGSCPVWAIGGISAATAGEVLATGVDGIAAIGAFIPRPTGESVAAAVENATRKLRFCFDSSAELS